MKTLRQIMDAAGSDKGGLMSDRHNYVSVYESLMAPRRNGQIALLEIGVSFGFSILGWLEYFSEAHITAIDINLRESAPHLPSDHPRLKLLEGAAQSFADSFGEVFDFIIDDADHAIGTQIALLGSYWAKVKPGGYYIIEDLFVGRLPWQAMGSPKSHGLKLPYTGYARSPSQPMFPKYPQDISFLSRKAVPAQVCQILDENEHFFAITSVSKNGGLHMMLVLRKAEQSAI